MLPTGRKGRRLKNVWLTRRFHWHYMGLWILLTLLVCSVLTYICYLIVELPAADLYSMSQDRLDAHLKDRSIFLLGAITEAIVVSGLVILLAIVTANRVAGPYIRLMAVCNAIREGDFGQRLKFRKYDHLASVEVAFNDMLEKLMERRTQEAAGGAGPATKGS